MDCTCARENPILVFKKIFCFQTRIAVYIVAALEMIFYVFLIVDHLGFTGSKIPCDEKFPNSSDNNGFETGLNMSKIPESESSDCKVSVADIFRVLPLLVKIVFSALLIHGVRKNILNLLRFWLWARFMSILDEIVEFAYNAPLQDYLYPVEVIIGIVAATGAIIIARSHLYYVRLHSDFIALEVSRKGRQNGGDLEDGSNESEERNAQ